MFEYTTTLHKIRKMDSKIRIVCGGSSAGKTYAILPIIIDYCIKNDDILASVVSESMPHLKRGAIRDFMNIMKDTGRFIRSHWNKTTSTYTFSNGSVLEFFSADKSDKLRGARRNILFVNECNNIDMESFNQLSIRTQSKKPKGGSSNRVRVDTFPSIIFLDYNPVGPFWIDKVRKDINSDFIRVTYRDNEVVSKDVVDFFRQREEWAKTDEYWENWVKVFVNGLQGQLMGAIFDNYKTITKTNLDNLISNKEVELLGRGIDFGFSSDPLAVSEVWIKRDDIGRDKLYLRELIYKTDQLNSDLYKELKTMGLNGRENIYVADSAEPKSIAELRKYGLRVRGVKKGPDTINWGINLMKEHDIIVDESSVNLIKEMNNYQWATNRSGDSLSKPEDKWNHLIDSIRYVVMDRTEFNKTSKPSVMF